MRSFYILTIFSTLIFTSCLPLPSTVRNSAKKSSNATTGTTNDTTGSNSSLPNGLVWHFRGEQQASDLTIDADGTSTAFLRGVSVNTYLSTSSNSSYNYCLVFKFSNSNPKKQLRIRATADTFTNIAEGTTEQLFRAEFPNPQINQAVCTGTINALPAVAATVSYDPDDLCSGASCPGGTIKADKVELFNISTGNTLISDFNFSTRGLSINLASSNNTNPGGGGSCTDQSCTASGYDCCLENQCVNDAEQRPNAAANSDYAQAISDYNANSTTYINWPEIFYVCPNGGPTDPVDPTDPAPPTLAELTEKYNCQEEYRSAGTQVQCSPDYTTVHNQIYLYCGCEADPNDADPLNRPENACPDFVLDPVTSSSGTLTEYRCLDADTSTTPVDQVVQVKARSVPHRFFDSAGTETEDISTLQGTTTVQEGTTFYYLDNTKKVGAQNGSFNINSILGQISVELDQAHPAKVVTVEYDANYVIGAANGSYNPCPTCTADSWNNLFTAWPSVVNADGLTARGHATDRSGFEYNTTNGNYGDTHFGRACYIPPTMIPYSHYENADLQTQRQARLETQAALFANGYQRDWFGFNKGALIGSFDGVTWFAVGNGRSVRATSTKLYLAINAPFGDLAANTEFTVNVNKDSGSTTAKYDYDPNLTYQDQMQNQAGSCQQYHMCEVDRDCITQLGWEYRCADITKVKTKWPKFDNSAVEQANDSKTISYFQLIVGGIPSSDFGNKRCVYRGAGAICKIDIEAGSLTSEQKKHLTCAPNFYCAGLATNTFNQEVARDPQGLFNVLYGQEANVLGRPLQYLSAGQSLPAASQTAIDANLDTISSQTDYGLCRPGKDISQNNHVDQQELEDQNASVRADYISQISSCDPTISSTTISTLVSRVQGCPLIDTTGNLVYTDNTGNSISDGTNTNDLLSQNACGNASQTALGANNFSSIEEPSLSIAGSIVQPTLALNSCLRRAGSPCHSDLDCSPNIFHANIASSLSNTSFGGTDAEKNYWMENLVCGQAEDKPVPTSSRYSKYDMTKNRCCRAVGEDLTMAIEHEDIDLTTPTITANTTTPDTSSTTHFSFMDPSRDRRYSRYQVIFSELQAGNIPYPSISYDQSNNRIAGVLDADITVQANQWKVYNSTGQKTCCGGSWIRKFDSGDHNWATSKDKLTISKETFECLNYSNEYIDGNPNSNYFSNADYAADRDKSCIATKDGGCPQVNFTSDGIAVINTFPTEIATTETANFYTALIPTPGSLDLLLGHTNISDMSPFYPRIDQTTLPSIPDGTFFMPPDAVNPGFPAFDSFIEYYLPSYIVDGDLNSAGGLDLGNLIEVNIIFQETSASPVTTTYDLGAFAAGPPVSATGAAVSIGGTNITFTATIIAGASPIKLRITCTDGNAATSDCNFFRAFPELVFRPMNSANFTVQTAGDKGDPGVGGALTRGTAPGSDMYYLSKLGRYELLGIPEIHVQPIMCNSNKDKFLDDLVKGYTSYDAFLTDATNIVLLDQDIQLTPGVSSNTLVAGSEFEFDSNSDGTADSTQKVVLHYSQVNKDPVFSPDEFTCCAKLGTVTLDPAKCCTGYTKENQDGDPVCMIPSGVDLNVLFNRFVSGEGEYDADDLPDGLVDADFDSKTGEPLHTQTVQDKLIELGNTFCSSDDTVKIRSGAAFGTYLPEPTPADGQIGGSFSDLLNPGSGIFRYGPNDSDNDSDIISDPNGDEFGTTEYEKGFKWNHHLYCK